MSKYSHNRQSNPNSNTTGNNKYSNQQIASLDDVDEYLDMLYQVSGKSYSDNDNGIKMQIHGTAMILQLCCDVMNLEQLIQNSTMMGALARVLQDEHKKSIELSFNILRIFLAFSNFNELHALLANYKVGLLTMKVIEYELKRYESYEQELNIVKSNFDNEISKINTIQDSSNQYENFKHNERLVQMKSRDTKRLLDMKNKQEKLLFIAFYILRNLATDIHVERKMLKKDLLQFIISTLEFNYCDLLILVLMFLQKLVLYEDCKNILRDNIMIIPKLVKLLTCSFTIVVNTTLRLLFNLSFDETIRKQMIENDIIPIIVNLLKTPSYRAKTLKLLYHLSVDDIAKTIIANTDVMDTLIGMIVNFPTNKITKELAAVVINLCLHGPNIERIIANQGLSYLMERLDSTKDHLLLKIIRNISLWTFNHQRILNIDTKVANYPMRGLWSPHIKIILKLASENESHDILLEALGCLANLTFNDMPSNLSWSKILIDYHFLSLISKLLIPSMIQNDILLEIIMLLSNISSEIQVANILASSNIITLLYETWKEKSEDPEIKLQLIYCFYKLILYQSTREEVLYGTRVVLDIIECLSHKFSSIRKMADMFCEIVIECDRDRLGKFGQLSLQIIKKRFESYNHLWVEAIMHSFSSRGFKRSDLDEDESGDMSDGFSPRHERDFGGNSKWN